MIKLLKKFSNSVLALILLGGVTLNSCALSPGMSSFGISSSSNFDKLNLEFYNIEEVDLKSLPTHSEKYKIDNENLEKLIKENEYRYLLGSGDVISIKVVDIDEVNGDFTLDAEGYISLPYAGKILVANLTKLDAENLISEVLSEYYQNPQTIISIKEFKSRYIYITGEITKPQSILLTDKAVSLMDIIIEAGYIKDQKTYDKKALLKRGSDVYTIDLYELFNEINIDKNIFLREDDIIHVQKKNEDMLYVFGEATQGTYPIFQNSTLTELLSNTKINQVTANANKIYVIREDLTRPLHGMIYQLNAKNPAALIYANNFNLLPQDVVFISASGIVRWNRVISLITPQSGIFSTYRDANKSLRYDESDL